MKKACFVTALLLIFSCSIVKAQTFEKTFSGCWGDTNWEFEFAKNGHCKRVSSGHFGFTTVKGKYRIENDTLHILSGYKDTYGTVNEQYVIDKDSILIDIKLGYGYLLATKKYDGIINEQCDLNYPEIQAVNDTIVQQVEEALNMAFNSEAMKQYYHFDKFPTRKLLVANYCKLQANITVDDRQAVFMPKENIKEKFYIEFENFYDTYQLMFRVIIHGEGVRIWFFYEKEGGKLVAKEPIITEK